MAGKSEKWFAPVTAGWHAAPDGAAVAVCFPGYRPDLGKELARRLKAVFYDFRQIHLAPLGWDASSLPLHVLDDAAASGMVHGSDLVLYNSESLLSLATPSARKLWFAQALGKRWPRKLLLPVTLYAADLPDCDDERIITLSAEDLPPESILERLSGLQ